MLAPDRIAAAVAGLDPQSRALLELSARRGMSDEEIGGILRVDTDEVGRRRERALESLGAALGLTGPDEMGELRGELGGLDAGHWERKAAPPEPDKSAAIPASVVEPEPEQEQEKTAAGDGERRGRRPASILAALAVVAIGAVVAIVVASGKDDEKTPRAGAEPAGQGAPATDTSPATGTATSAKDTAPAPAKPQPGSKPGPAVTFQRLQNTHGRGTMQLVRRGKSALLRLRVNSFLRPQGGGYAVWLYNTPTDARQLATTRFTSFHGDLRVPRDYTRYRFVDISRETNGDRHHGGLSLLRAPLR